MRLLFCYRFRHRRRHSNQYHLSRVLLIDSAFFSSKFIVVVVVGLLGFLYLIPSRKETKTARQRDRA